MAVSSVVRITNAFSNISMLGYRGNQLGQRPRWVGMQPSAWRDGDLLQKQLCDFLCLGLPPGIKLLGEKSLPELMHPSLSSPNRTRSKTVPGWRKGSLLLLLPFAGSLTDT